MIPSNIGHGSDLVCSFAACRNAGVKFRYCAVCRVPVAKRNFHQRHGHGIPTTRREETAQKNNSGYAVAKKDEMKLEKKPHLVKPPSSDAAVAGRNSNRHTKKMKPPTQTVEVRRPVGGSSSRFNAQDSLKRTGSNRKQTIGCSPSSSTSTSREVPRDRQMQWAALLRRRPDTNDADGMSAWLLEVMAVSDLKTPFKQGASSLTTNNVGSSEVSSYTDEPTSSLNPLTSSDGEFSSDVSSLGQEHAVRKPKRQKIRVQMPEQLTRKGLPSPTKPGDNKGKPKSHKKKERTFDSEEVIARERPKHKRSKEHVNITSSPKRESDTKEKKPEKNLEKKSAKVEGDYAEWRERNKQKAPSKKRKPPVEGVKQPCDDGDYA